MKTIEQIELIKSLRARVHNIEDTCIYAILLDLELHDAENRVDRAFYLLQKQEQFKEAK